MSKSTTAEHAQACVDAFACMHLIMDSVIALVGRVVVERDPAALRQLATISAQFKQ